MCFWDRRADRPTDKQINKQTHRHADHNTLPTYWKRSSQYQSNQVPPCWWSCYDTVRLCMKMIFKICKLWHYLQNIIWYELANDPVFYVFESDFRLKSTQLADNSNNRWTNRERIRLSVLCCFYHVAVSSVKTYCSRTAKSGMACDVL